MIQIKHVTFTYQAAEAAGGVYDIDLTIPAGQVVLLCGESGCGKTTLTRLLNGLIPHYFEGTLTGSVEIGGKLVSAQPLYETARLVGSVFQNPRSQFFNVDTTSEITFGCENLGMPEAEIRSSLAHTVSALRLEPLLDRSIFALSGGEKQRIACAGAFMMEPQVFVLDEPSSNLDADAIQDLRRVIAYLKSLGKTVVVSEHRLYYLQGIADRYLYLKAGRICGDYTQAQFAALSDETRQGMGLRACSIAALSGSGSAPSGQTAALRDFRFAYKNAPETLRIDTQEIPYGGIVAIIGHNGAGKSTFCRCFCGLEKCCGAVAINGKRYRPKDRLRLSYMVMQDAGHQLFAETVLDEVLISMAEEDETAAKKILAALDLTPYLARHPASLSGGQKQRLAIASAIAAQRTVLFFDEPTSGLDYRHMLQTAQLLQQLRQSGKTAYLITHDPELICACCTDVIHLEAGRIAACYPMDEAGVTKVRSFFCLDQIHSDGVCG